MRETQAERSGEGVYGRSKEIGKEIWKEKKRKIAEKEKVREKQRDTESWIE